MTSTVRERADAVATLRYVSVYLMEIAARWVPTTPELEVKVLFGRHIWVLAQHADALGRRTAELRLGLQASREPTPSFMEVLQRLADSETTHEKLTGFYDAVLPIVSGLCERYVTETDEMMDEPTIRILDTMMRDFDRMRQERARDMGAAPPIPEEGGDIAGDIEHLAESASDWVVHRDQGVPEVTTP